MLQPAAYIATGLHSQRAKDLFGHKLIQQVTSLSVLASRSNYWQVALSLACDNNARIQGGYLNSINATTVFDKYP